MRIRNLFLAALVLCAGAYAQLGPGGGARGRGMGGPMRSPFRGGFTKIFGDNTAFSASMLMETKLPGGSDVSMPAKMYYLDGKGRLEIDSTQITGSSMPPRAAAQMKAMGMSEMITISRPDKKESYMIYPGLKAYAALPVDQAEEPANDPKAALRKTELGKETIDGHPTTKYKVMIKDEDGKEQEVTIWCAADLKDFPVRISMQTEAGPSTINFKDVKLGKPDADLFNPPADFQKYTDLGTMMREAMMKRFAPPNGPGAPGQK